VYKAPAKLTPEGSELERALLAELRRIEVATAAAPAPVRDQRGVVPIRPQPGDFVRVGPGQTVILPHPRTSRGQAVYLLLEGTADVLAMSGTVNGATVIGVDIPGLVVAVSSGAGWHVTGGDVTVDMLPTGAAGLPLAGNGVGSAPSYQQIDSNGLNMAASYAWTGAQIFSGRVAYNGVFSGTLAAGTNNLAIGNANVVRLTLTGNQNLTGMVPAADAHAVWLFNTDSADTLTLVHNSGLSSVGNQFLCPANANYALGPRTGVALWADTLSDFWLVLSN
jgi:hypothetical protein